MLYVFQKIDADGNGVLTQAEVLAFCSVAFPMLDKDEVTTEILQVLDKDGDNHITPNEFLMLLPMYCQSTGWYHPAVGEQVGSAEPPVTCCECRPLLRAHEVDYA